MLFNLDFMIVILAIIVVGSLSAYTIYVIFPVYFKPINVSFSNIFNFLALYRLSSIGTVSPNDRSTSVQLSDEELNQLLEVVFREIGNSNEISAALLQSLGLYTSTVINYLEALGYIIF